MSKDALEGKKIGFIGAGNMAEAIIQGLVDSRTLPANHIMASDVVPDRLEFMATQYGITTTGANDELVAASDILVLAVKPQVAGPVMAPLKNCTDDSKLVISIVAGLTVAAMAEALGMGTRIIRTVPNTPVFVGEGMVALASGKVPFLGRGNIGGRKPQYQQRNNQNVSSSPHVFTSDFDQPLKR